MGIFSLVATPSNFLTSYSLFLAHYFSMLTTHWLLIHSLTSPHSFFLTLLTTHFAFFNVHFSLIIALSILLTLRCSLTITQFSQLDTPYFYFSLLTPLQSFVATQRWRGIIKITFVSLARKSVAIFVTFFFTSWLLSCFHLKLGDFLFDRKVTDSIDSSQ